MSRGGERVPPPPASPDPPPPRRYSWCPTLNWQGPATDSWSHGSAADTAKWSPSGHGNSWSSGHGDSGHGSSWSGHGDSGHGNSWSGNGGRPGRK